MHDKNHNKIRGKRLNFSIKIRNITGFNLLPESPKTNFLIPILKD